MWDWITDAENVAKSKLADVGINLWDEWFIQMIPDLAGYGTLVAGGWMMIGSMFGRGQIFKALAFLSAGLIVSVCILEMA